MNFERIIEKKHRQLEKLEKNIYISKKKMERQQKEDLLRYESYASIYNLDEIQKDVNEKIVLHSSLNKGKHKNPINYNSALPDQIKKDIAIDGKKIILFDNWLTSSSRFSFYYKKANQKKMINFLLSLKEETIKNLKAIGRNEKWLWGNYIFINTDKQLEVKNSRGKVYVGVSQKDVFARVLEHIKNENNLACPDLHRDLEIGDYFKIYILPQTVNLNNEYSLNKDDWLNFGNVLQTERELIQYYLRKGYHLYNKTLGANDLKDTQNNQIYIKAKK